MSARQPDPSELAQALSGSVGPTVDKLDTDRLPLGLVDLREQMRAALSEERDDIWTTVKDGFEAIRLLLAETDEAIVTWRHKEQSYTLGRVAELPDFWWVFKESTDPDSGKSIHRTTQINIPGRSVASLEISLATDVTKSYDEMMEAFDKAFDEATESGGAYLSGSEAWEIFNEIFDCFKHGGPDER